MKRLNPNLKVMISLGGWTWSSYFSDAALTLQSRRAFVKSCIDLYIKGLLPQDPPSASQGTAAGVFDGIDVDWEYPGVCGNTCGPTVARPEDTRNFTLLIQEFRRQLVEQGVHDRRSYLLSIAAAAGPQTFAYLELDKLAHTLDYINLMSYDYHGGWESQTNFQSALFASLADPTRAEKFNTDDSVRAYLRAGVPASKLVVGVPAYSRGWQDVHGVNNGLYQPGTAPADWVSLISFSDAQALLKTGTFTRFYDPATLAAWIYDPAAKIFWTYDDSGVMSNKVNYVSALGLGGIMMWELSNDTENGELINTLSTSLRAGKKPSYPLSAKPMGDDVSQ